MNKRGFSTISVVVLILFLVIGGVFVANRLKLGKEPGKPPFSGEKLCNAGDSISCSELGSIWREGTAKCRSDGSGYDVSSCSLAKISSIDYEVVKPAERDSNRWSSARCNDGTPFSYQVHLTGSKDWVIWLEGGGFCDDNAKSCSTRPPSHSSTLPEKDGTIHEERRPGIFVPDKSANPTFYNANMVIAEYCSSDGWGGTTTKRIPSEGDPQNGWYFSGKLNVNAMLESLAQGYGLDDSDDDTKVLFSGSSAGGEGSMVNADLVAKIMPKAASEKRVFIVADAGGFTPNFDNPDYRPGEADVSVRDVFLKAVSKYKIKTNPLCEEAQLRSRKDPKNCVFGDLSHPYIIDEPPKGLGLQLFVQTSSVDSFNTELHGIDNRNDPDDRAAYEEYRKATLDVLEKLSDNVWIFSGGNSYHTLLHQSGKDGWEMGPSGKSFRDMLTRFWNGGKPERVIFGNP